MITIDISTMDELLQFVKALSDRHGSNKQLWYRGEDNSTLTLVPSIQRSERRLERERFLSNDFYIRAKQTLESPPSRNNYAYWIALMQHYGLPTRILDWSRSPLIAVFFATETYRTVTDQDACVWVLVPDALNAQEGFDRCIYPIDADTTQEMLLPAFKHRHHNPELEDKILACASTDPNMRMYAQQSCFTVHNSLRKLEDICDEQMLYKIIIPRDRKQYFIDSLRVLGITESFIYPDLEHICRDLRNYHNI